uniref:Glycosyltransferase n=1 Tax=Trollius chinensis TaxID=78479 RepID=A0A4Y5RXX8_9MAGN|nr:C-glycosyltransferase 1 [Trollius chinensis]6JTD_A Chain A, C-glycosyltransferase [Trollius chinensis]6JTD_B Chain B, C-glycosyltransferase [Trollius chinensis]
MEKSNPNSTSKPHVFLLASPGMGHLIPFLELSKRLVTLNTLQVTLFIVSNEATKARSHLMESSNNFHPDLELVDLTPANLSELLSTDATVFKRIFLITQAAIKDLESRISSMSTPPAALIVDVFSMDAFPVADRFGIKKYVFVTLNAWFLALTTYVRTLDREIEGEYVDLPEPIAIPGCKPLRPEDVFDPMLSRSSDGYRPYLGMSERLTKADGLLLNTWEALEPVSLKALRENEKLNQIMTPPLYPVGPVARTTVQEVVGNECLDWLSKQPTESVLYVALGSGGIISYKQMTELAWGLEMSRQRFIWVVRLPTMEKDGACRFFSDVNVKGPLEYLPEGFLDRNKELGMVLPNWGPQDAILAHPSTGGFLSHCGWNSSLESIVNGVPVIAWPLYAEQKMNATLLTEELGVAVRPEVLPTKAVVSRDEIEKMVRRVIESKEGKMKRNRARSVQSDALKAIEKGGSSYNTLIEVAKEFEKNHKVL